MDEQAWTTADAGAARDADASVDARQDPVADDLDVSAGTPRHEASDDPATGDDLVPETPDGLDAPDAPLHGTDDLADIDDPQVLAALAALADLSDLELPEHVAVLEHVHAALQARLTDAEA